MPAPAACACAAHACNARACQQAASCCPLVSLSLPLSPLLSRPREGSSKRREETARARQCARGGEEQRASVATLRRVRVSGLEGGRDSGSDGRRGVWAAGEDWEAELRAMFESGVWQVRPRGLFGGPPRASKASSAESASSPSHSFLAPAFFLACAAGIAATVYLQRPHFMRLFAARLSHDMGVFNAMCSMWSRSSPVS